jgi:hypothetical protein
MIKIERNTKFSRPRNQVKANEINPEINAVSNKFIRIPDISDRTKKTRNSTDIFTMKPAINSPPLKRILFSGNSKSLEASKFYSAIFKRLVCSESLPIQEFHAGEGQLSLGEVCGKRVIWRRISSTLVVTVLFARNSFHKSWSPSSGIYIKNDTTIHTFCQVIN